MSERKIRIKFFGIFRELSSRRDYSVKLTDFSTVKSVLEGLEKELDGLEDEFFDDDGNLLSRVNVFVNGENIRVKSGLDTVLGEGDKITIFPPFGGG